MKRRKLGLLLGFSAVILGVTFGSFYWKNKEKELVRVAGEKDTKEESGKAVSKNTVKEEIYHPIPKGWSVSKSMRGRELTHRQKKVVDELVEHWKKELYTDAELQTALTTYLLQEDIEVLEVSVVGGSYTIRAVIPEVELDEKGSLYQYMGLYSSGKQSNSNPEATDCYQWTVFIF